MSRYVTAYYDDEQDLLKGIGQMKNKGLDIIDVLTPFPVHGMDKALGMRPTRLSRIAFVGGAIGGLLGFLFQSWIFTIDYPLNIGGKPFFSAPSFIPVTFELTILFAAFTMVGGFLTYSKLRPGAKAVVHDERSTDDRFLVVVNLGKESSEENEKQVGNVLSEAGAKGITFKE